MVFRARSMGGSPGRQSGVYTRQMLPEGDNQTIANIETVANLVTPVPAPNNTPPTETFIEFPSIPRIAINSDALATRGNHRPVWAIGSEDERVGAPLETVADTTTDGEVLDPAAQGLPVTELGLERDGFRGNNSSSTREWASNKAKRATAGPGST